MVALLALSTFFFSPMPLDWQLSHTSVAIRGKVIDEGDHHPIAGAVVYAMSDTFLAKTTADSRGIFFFLDLIPARYTLCASKDDYVLDCSPRDSEPVELFDGFEYGATVVLSHSIN